MAAGGHVEYTKMAIILLPACQCKQCDVSMYHGLFRNGKFNDETLVLKILDGSRLGKSSTCNSSHLA